MAPEPRPAGPNPAPEKRRGHRGRHSLFFKLFTVSLVTVVLTLLAVGAFYRSFWHPVARAAAHSNLAHYAELLIREIGAPPDTAAAERLSRELGLTIALRGPGLRWSHPEIPARAWERINAIPANDSTRLRVRRGRLIVTSSQGGYVYAFGSKLRQFLESRGGHWLLLAGILSGVWFLAWLALRHLLRPVRSLAQGVAQVEAGNLDVRLSERGRDELAELAHSFNSMARSLQERLRARDQLLLDVSHELRSPLTRMRVALEMAEPCPAMESLREEVDSLEKMVSEILETERLQSGSGGLRRESVDLPRLVREVIEGFGSGSKLIFKKDSGDPTVEGDVERLRLVFRNLIENALKHGGAGLPVEISLRIEGDRVLAEVRDQGPGIPEAEQRLVFEPFYRTDRSRSLPGYGLGLSLCKRIVEAHGGSIALKSGNGDGTAVTVRLPLKAGA